MATRSPRSSSARTARRCPVAIHWDHGGTYEQVLEAIQLGFTSAMIDASMQPFEDNVAITTKVVDTAHAVGLSVEGELGTIGKLDEQAEDGVLVARSRTPTRPRPSSTSSAPAWTASRSPSAPRTACTRST